jgi:alpha-glucosidase
MHLSALSIQKKTALLLVLSLFILSCSLNNKTLLSPNKNIVVNFQTDEQTGAAFYSISNKTKEIITKSRVGVITKGKIIPTNNLKIISVNKLTVNKTWKPVYGEKKLIVDNYNQYKVVLADKNATDKTFTIIFRVYNEGVALKYEIPKQQNRNEIEIESELTEFTLPTNAPAYVTYATQGKYEKIKISEIKRECERPLVVEIDKENIIAIGEAALVDYARMRIDHSENKKNTLIPSLASEVILPLPMQSPWRFIMIAHSPGELLEHSYFTLNLNEPCAIDDVSWIKPGKVLREVTLTTTGGIACVDFAAKNDFQYILFDAGWYGWEDDEKADATTVTIDPRRSKGPLDLQKVIDYGKSKNIGVILYVNRRALEKQLDEILPLYKSWGVAGVKYGFVQTGSQKWTSWLHEAIRKAAKYKLMVDIHDRYRPTGYTRTYPNFMNREGVRGDEASPSSKQTLTTIFTRLLTGAADNTICYYSKRVTERMGSHASQLAKAVCIYGPWHSIFWYDRPPGAPGTESGIASENRVIGDEPEIDFFRKVPTVWDDTKVLEGAVGEYATIARRSGKNWFVGSINGDSPHTVNIKLDFLEKEKKYKTVIYSDDPEIQTRTHVRIEEKKIGAEDTLTYNLQPKTGLAIRIVVLQ